MWFKPRRTRRVLASRPQTVTVWAAILTHCAYAVYRRHPFTAHDERFRFSIFTQCRIGISLVKKMFFAQCVHNAPYLQETEPQRKPTNIRWVPFFIRQYERQYPNRASGASHNHTVPSVAMIVSGTKRNGDAGREPGHHWLRHPRKKSVHHAYFQRALSLYTIQG